MIVKIHESLFACKIDSETTERFTVITTERREFYPLTRCGCLVESSQHTALSVWLQSDFSGDLGGAKFHGHGLDGYDLNRKKYVGHWVDSMSSAPMDFEGNYEGKVLVMTGESLGPDGKKQKFKNTTEVKDKDHFTFKMYMVTPEGKDTLAFSIEYTRRK